MVDQATEGLSTVSVPNPDDSTSARSNNAGAPVVHQSPNTIPSPGGPAATISDVSQPEQTADESGRQEEILQKIFDHIPLMISLSGPDGRYRLVNREWERTLGWSQDEILARGHEIFSELYPDPRRREEALRFIISATGQWRDFKTTTRDGRVIDTTFARMELSDGTSIGIGRDTTGRRRADEALRQAEKKYRDIFENAREGIFQTTEDGRFLAANPALARMLGFDSAVELIRERNNIAQQSYVDPARRDELKRLLHQYGAVTDFEHQAFRKDGAKIWISESVRAVRDEQGTVLYYEGTCQDITERKRAENQSAGFAALARRLSGVTTALDAAQIIADTAHDLFGWDSLILDLYDEDHDAVHPMLHVDTIGGRLVDVTPPSANRPPTSRCRRVILGSAQLIAREEAGEFNKDTGPFGAQPPPSTVLMDVPIRHAFRAIGILSIQSYTPCAYDARALSDLQTLADYCGEALNRIRTEKSLYESEERYRELFENAKDPMYVLDLRGRYTSVNCAAETLTGYDRHEILGKYFGKFLVPEHVKGVRDRMRQKLADGVQTVYELEVLTRDGRRVPVEVNSRLIYENGVPLGVQGTVRDITERKHSQAALQSFSRRLMEMQEAERQRLSRELHDEIGQVLTAVRINMEAVQRAGNTEQVSAQIEDSLTIIDEALRQVRNMSLDLRPPHLDDFGLSSALRWYIDRYARRAGTRMVFIDEQPPEQPRLRQDLETACFRIVQEALTNVARHANAKTVSVKLARSNGYLVLTIQDDGIGFEMERLRSYASTNATLGVRGMEERAQAVGGRIEIESLTGKGTKIHAQFPIARTMA